MVRAPPRNSRGVEHDDPQLRIGALLMPSLRRRVCAAGPLPSGHIRSEHDHRSEPPVAVGPEPSCSPVRSVASNAMPLRRGRRGAPTFRALAVPPGAAPGACSGRLGAQPPLGSPQRASSAASTGPSRADQRFFAPPAMAVHQSIGGRVALHEPSRLSTLSLSITDGVTWTPRIRVAPRSTTGGRSPSPRGRTSLTENLRPKRLAVAERRAELDGPGRWRHPS